MDGERLLTSQVFRQDHQFIKLNSYTRRPRQIRMGQAVIIFDDLSKNPIDHCINDDGTELDGELMYDEDTSQPFPLEHTVNTDKSLQQAMASREPKTCKARHCSVILPTFPANRMPVRDSVGCLLKYRQITSEMKKDSFRDWEVRHSRDYNPRKNRHEWKEKLPNIRMAKRIDDDEVDANHQIRTSRMGLIDDDLPDDAINTNVQFLPHILTKEKHETGDSVFVDIKSKDTAENRANLWAHAGDNPWASEYFSGIDPEDVNTSPGGDDMMRVVNTKADNDYINQFLSPVEEANRCMDVAMFGQGIRTARQVNNDAPADCYPFG